MTGEKLPSKRTHRHTIEVSGNGPFPMDMLRYDSCYPAEERDSHTIEHTLNPMIESKPWIIRVSRLSDATAGWTLSRWASLHCEVKFVNYYAPRPE